MTRTFVDACVLIAAAVGEGELHDRAMDILDDPAREFASSPLLRLEVLPKAVFNKRTGEAEFYEAFFSGVAHWAQSVDALLASADREAREQGVGAIDALHVAAAAAVGATELVTAERPEKSIFRARSVKVVSIRPASPGQ